MRNTPEMATPDTARAFKRPLKAVRLLRGPDAAAYCGIALTTFNKWVAMGRVPVGKAVDSCVLWDIRALDAAIDELFYSQKPVSTPLIREPEL